jgi:5-methylcytosine-specific restriction endonuclease McrA
VKITKLPAVTRTGWWYIKGRRSKQAKRDKQRYASTMQRARILFRDHNRCRYCGNWVQPEEANFDHVKPWKYGGQTKEKNLVTACRDCNKRKGNSTWSPRTR